MTSVEDAKLKEILQFLKSNRKWNRNYQIACYRKALSNAKDPVDRLKGLLFNSVNSQSQPKLDLLLGFWRKVEAYKWHKRPPTVESLTAALATFLDESDKAKWQQGSAGPWHRLYQVLRLQKGWGKKTAALFVKAAINMHRSSDTSLHFLEFHGPILKRGDRLYLPVDAVIIRIFRRLGRRSPTFDSINNELEQLSQNDVLVLDDLWFWGFITQRSNGDKRKIKWNPAKFWGLQSSPKAREKEIERLAGKFITLLDRTSAYGRSTAKR